MCRADLRTERLLGEASANAAIRATNHKLSTLSFVGEVTESSGLNAQGVPDGLGKYGTVHLALRELKTPHGKVVGSLSAEILVTSVIYSSTTLQIGVLVLPHGTIAVQGGQAENQQVGTLDIAGGSGKYLGAAGTVRIVSGASGTGLTITLVRS